MKEKSTEEAWEFQMVCIASLVSHTCFGGGGSAFPHYFLKLFFYFAFTMENTVTAQTHHRVNTWVCLEEARTYAFKEVVYA